MVSACLQYNIFLHERQISAQLRRAMASEWLQRKARSRVHFCCLLSFVVFTYASRYSRDSKYPSRMLGPL